MGVDHAYGRQGSDTMNGAADASGRHEPEVITLTTDDNFPLAAVLYRPPSNNESGATQSAIAKRKPVLVSGALGVPQRFYAPFCGWLASRGHTVMTFDLRGIGESLPRGQTPRRVNADMLSWARVDFAAAVHHLCCVTGAAQINLIGHSLGAQHSGMGKPATQQRIAKLVSVGAGAGYWREWAAPSRRAAPLMFYLAGPVLTPLFGYFPGKRLGMVGDLPAGVMRQFSRWCCHPEFAWGAQPELLLPSLQSALYPIHALSFSDDEAMTEANTRKLFAAHPNAPCVVEVVTPKSMGVARIGHTGAFRREMESRLWPHLESCLAG
jgi:predicted alpha/beta hydrolase